MPVSPPVLGEDIRQWGRALNTFLSRNLGKLFFRTSADNPSENGIFLWDDEKNYPVVSAQNTFKANSYAASNSCIEYRCSR